MCEIPKIGVAAIIRKQKKVLLGKRKNSLGEGTWCFPGGHLEFGESWEECSLRETKEETDIEIKNIQFVGVTNDVFKEEKKHYVTIFLSAEYADGKVKLAEPEKFEKWEWFDWDNLPSPLLLPIENLLKKGYNPFK